MSIVAPKSYWDIRSIIDLMNKDSFVTIMKMTEKEIENRVNLANIVLNKHDSSHSLLDGKLSDVLLKCVVYYRDMLLVFRKEQLEIDVPINDRFGFGPDNGLRSYIS
jgi:hypothetical protein